MRWEREGGLERVLRDAVLEMDCGRDRRFLTNGAVSCGEFFMLSVRV